MMVILLTSHCVPNPEYRCRFSQMLHPIFEEASNIVREEFPNTNQVVFARVDCDQHCEYCLLLYLFFEYSHHLKKSNKQHLNLVNNSS